MYKNRHRWILIALMVVDCMISLAAIFFAGMMRYSTVRLFFRTINLVEIVPIVLISTCIAFVISHMYRDFFKRGYLLELQHTAIFSFLILLFLSLYSFSTKNNFALSRLTLLYFAMLDGVLTYSCHIFIRKINKQRVKGKYGWKLLVIADGDNAAAACRNIQNSDWKDRAIGIILLDGQAVDPGWLSGIPVIDLNTGYMEYIVQNTVDEVLFSIAEDRYQTEAVQTLLSQITETGAILSMQKRFPADDLPHVSKLTNFGDSYVISLANREYDYLEIAFKRVLDIAGGLVGVLLTAIAGLFLAPAIWIESPGPLLFRQKRVGRNGRVFTMLKFRSMYADAEEKKAALMDQNEMSGPLFKLKNDPRITRVGKFIRKTSLDEFPQFFNVLRGDMSLVGTRPPTLEEYQQYTGAQKKRLSFRPGLTGIWQVSGRNEVKNFDDVMKMDLQYIQEWSTYLDIKLILKTILVAIRGKGAE